MRTKRANRSGPVPFLQHAPDRQKAGRASGFLSKGRLQGQSRVGNPEIDRSRVVLQQSIDPLAQLDFAPHAVHAGYQRIDETVGHILAARITDMRVVLGRPMLLDEAGPCCYALPSRRTYSRTLRPPARRPNAARRSCPEPRASSRTPRLAAYCGRICPSPARCCRGKHCFM